MEALLVKKFKIPQETCRRQQLGGIGYYFVRIKANKGHHIERVMGKVTRKTEFKRLGKKGSCTETSALQ